MKKINTLWLFIMVILFTTSAFSQEDLDLDLSILYIQRLPEMEYVQDSPNPAVEGWPAEGEEVTWRAKVKNWSAETATVTYRWYLDGVTIVAGQRIINGDTEIEIDSPTYNWTFERKVLKFAIDTGNSFDEIEEDNNELEIFTDAISVGFYVEQGVYDYFHDHQHELEVGSNNFNDWAHRQVRIWNDLFAEAIYPDTPDGVLDRIRLDKITVVDDNALPLGGGNGLPTNHPTVDKTVDLIWGFPNDYLDDEYFGDPTGAILTDKFDYDGNLFHELGHARYLIDVYSFNIESEGGQAINIQEDGVDIDESGLFPSPYRVDMPGLMNTQRELIDEYSAMALNLIEGHRATKGNANSPGNIGAVADGFMHDLPAENRILITAEDGLPLSGANVEIYQAEWGGGNSGYNKSYDDIPDFTLIADQDGYVYVGRNPFSDGSFIGGHNRTIIIRAEKNGDVGYAALECFRFNMEYWRDNTNLGTYTLAFENIVSECVNEQPYHNLSGAVDPGVYVAQDYIYSDGQVAAGSNVSFKAGNVVRLLPGFRAQTNGSSRFHAFIGSCTASNKEEIIDNDPILLRNYPNPFTGQTTVEFKLSKDTPVTLFVSDVTGRQIAVLLNNDEKTEGTHSVTFDGNNYPAGMYYYTIQAGEYYGTQKMILAK